MAARRVTMSVSSSPSRLSLREAAEAVARGEISAEELMTDCIARIEAREPTVRAWASLDLDRALDEARAYDRGPSRGPLHGVPLGVKDVLDTSDLPTQMGSPIYAGNRPRSDASCVAMLRAAGAIIIGKTVTCEFAGVEPGPTANPLDPSRTPGGSSSGSAAAVADYMVPAALGTQTGGSVLRPASFCGVVGLKPTFGAVSRSGLKFAAESLDTIGVITRTPDDADLLIDILSRRPVGPPPPLERPPRLALCRTFLWEEKVSPESQASVEQAVELAREAGAEVVELKLPGRFSRLLRSRDLINDVERSRALAWEWVNHRDLISPRLQTTIERGLAVTQGQYRDEMRFADRSRDEFDVRAGSFDGLIAPCVNGEAPVGLHYAGDPALQGLWTLLQVPTITIPSVRGPNGMPIGVQIVGKRWAGGRLIALANWLQQAGVGQEPGA